MTINVRICRDQMTSSYTTLEGKKKVSCSDPMFSSVRQSHWTWSPNPVGENTAAVWATCLFLETQQHPRKEGDT